MLQDFALAPRTQVQYERYWQVFAAWCAQHGLSSLPASTDTVVRFLEYCFAEKDVGVGLKNYANVIKRYHLMASLPAPTHDLAVQDLVKAGKRIGKKAVEAAPFSIECAREWCLRGRELVYGDEWQFAVISFVLLVGLRLMMRPGEFLRLQRSDVRFRDSKWWIRLADTKTQHISRTGQWMAIDPGRTPATCPVRALCRLLQFVPDQPDAPLVLDPFTGEPLTTARCSALLSWVARKLGDSEHISGKSLRIGGVIAGAAGGLSEAVIKSIGRWSSDAYLRYSRGSIGAAARASLAIGL